MNPNELKSHFKSQLVFRILQCRHGVGAVLDVDDRCCLEGTSGIVEVTGLSEEQQKKIMKSFKGIQSDDINERYQEWLRRIHENYFEIEDFDDNDATAEYSIPYIFEDMDFRRQFYDEINSHFDWVRDELEEHDIFVLKSTPIY